MEHGLIQKAMAFRVNYRRDQGSPKSKQPLRSMDVHALNRGSPEVYPNGDDVKTLGLQLIKSTFDYAEASHNGVAVEEVPAEVRSGGGGRGNALKDPWYP